MLSFLIMHYLTYVFVPKHEDMTQAVTEAMRPYGEGFEVTPWKRYLGPRELAAMARCYKLPKGALRKLAACMDDWNGGTGGVDEGGLHAVLTSNPDAKWDWYEIGGRWQGKFKDNAASCRALLRRENLADLLPHDFLTPDSVWHERSRYVPGDFLLGHFIDKSQPAWLREFTRALTRHRDCRVVCVDRHC